MSFFSKLFKKQKGGSIFGNLLRGVSKNIPIIGGSLGNGGKMIVTDDGKTAAQVAGMSTAQFNAAVGAGQDPLSKIQDINQAPTVANIIDNSGYPAKSNVFPNGADPTMLEPVTIKAPKTASASSNPFNINLNLDTKNGKYSADVNNQQSPVNGNLLLYGMLGLGAIMLLKNK